ncbi:MAG: DMT family transporter [Gammaproteobacteria bacterium]|nr:DMT family transporter [Gammaproteobacteria bacterium]
MKPVYLMELVILAALWGASFLFMRVGAPEFGPIVLIALRTAIAAIFLIPLVIMAGKLKLIKENALLLFVVGVIGTAIPFSLFSFAVLYVSAGYASILNATAPIFTALVAWIWVSERLTLSAALGLLIGFCGVVLLVLDDKSVSAEMIWIPVMACLAATLCYGIMANFARHKLGHVHPLAIAGGSQLGAALSLAPFGWWLWPHTPPGQQAWLAVIILGIASTAIAFILYFRLIANVGVTKAMTVTFLIPFFGVIWGMLFLQEALTVFMLGGGLLILIGVGLSTDILNRWRKSKAV